MRLDLPLMRRAILTLAVLFTVPLMARARLAPA